jgi:hypothetical protein
MLHSQYSLVDYCFIVGAKVAVSQPIKCKFINTEKYH